MAKYFVEDTSLTSVADAIRAKSGTTEALEFPGGFVSAVEGITAGGGSGESDPYAELYKSIVNGTAVNVVMPSDYGEVRAGLFYDQKQLKSFDFTHVWRIRDYAFYGSGLETVYIPKNFVDTHWGAYTFAECKSLVSVSAPNATRMYWSYSKPFANCTALKTVEMPNMTLISRSCFTGCTALEEISLPALVELRDTAFSGCTMLSSVNVPLLTGISGNAFASCTSLEFLDLPSVTTISAQGFQKSSKLNILVLRNETLVTLANVNAFTNTPFATNGTGGTVYVPAALIEQYRQATNWSTLYAAGTCNFVAIEGSEYE